MSEPNNKPFSSEKINHNFVALDESGKIKTQNDEVAQINDELNPEDLEDIAGGCQGTTVNTAAHCGTAFQ